MAARAASMPRSARMVFTTAPVERAAPVCRSKMVADISNNGTIIGGRSGGGFSYAGSAGDGIDMRAGGTATNTGVILAGAGGDATYANSTGGGVGVNLAEWWHAHEQRHNCSR